MGVVWSKEIAKGRTVSGKRSDGATYRREYLIRTNSPDTSLVDIVNACGPAYGDPHPDDATTFLDSYDCKAADESGLLYSVTLEYRKQTPLDEEDPGQPGGLDFRPPVWSGSSSVVMRPVYKDINGDTMTNSAGDPLEGLEAEQAEEKLTLTQYYLSHSQWMGLAKTYTNAINDAAWNGGPAKSWKCQGCSKKLNIENRDGVTFVYWEVTWEFAYREDLWTLKPWDVGFAQRVDENGEPSGAATKRALIKGQDGKPVRQPVALQGGVALPAGTPPVIVNNGLGFDVYREEPFDGVFGEIFTPSPVGGA